MYLGATLNRTFVPTTGPLLWQRRGNGDDGCQHDSVERRWGMTDTDPSVQTAAVKVQWCVSPINVLLTGCQLFPRRRASFC